jgi:hypothetical protein
MCGAFQRHFWRGAVGLIAAYAFVLQAFLAYGMAARAAASESSYAAAFFVLCAADDTTAAPDHESVPAKPNTHCPICTLIGSAAAALPEPVALPLWRAGQFERTSFVTAVACISFHQARAGLSRAPPQSV